MKKALAARLTLDTQSGIRTTHTTQDRYWPVHRTQPRQLLSSVRRVARLLHLALFISLPAWLFAQPEVLQSATRSISAEIDLANGKLNPAPSASQAPANLIQRLDLEAKDYDLIINYSLAPAEPDQYYQVTLNAELDGEPIRPAPEHLQGELGQPVTGTNHAISWTRLLEQYINLEGKISFTLHAELWGERILPIDCDVVPSFSGKQRLPHYIAAGAGALAIGAGQLFKNQSNDIYDNEYLASETLAEAQPRYDDANGKHHTYLILTYAGAAVLAVDAAWYIIRQIRYNKKMKLYKQYCPDAVGIRPIIELPSQNAPNGMAGLRLTLPLKE
ncbi:MAG: hypothetical protein KDD10_16840 [Phaeodactylibacter sp.]|nr:hypothetical protein [Phaeodactylibacter sp.]